MPVNMDPKNRRRRGRQAGEQADPESGSTNADPIATNTFGQETEEDREKDVADAEWTNLWDATEVIDMDKW